MFLLLMKLDADDEDEYADKTNLNNSRLFLFCVFLQ